MRQEPGRQGCFQPATHLPACKQPPSCCSTFCAPQTRQHRGKNQPLMPPAPLQLAQPLALSARGLHMLCVCTPGSQLQAGAQQLPHARPHGPDSVCPAAPALAVPPLGTEKAALWEARGVPTSHSPVLPQEATALCTKPFVQQRQ